MPELMPLRSPGFETSSQGNHGAAEKTPGEAKVKRTAVEGYDHNFHW
jgi:hypothetical protein